jgi:hypothetical protein
MPFLATVLITLYGLMPNLARRRGRRKLEHIQQNPSEAVCMALGVGFVPESQACRKRNPDAESARFRFSTCATDPWKQISLQSLLTFRPKRARLCGTDKSKARCLDAIRRLADGKSN